jgi:hypothetical protein
MAKQGSSSRVEMSRSRDPINKCHSITYQSRILSNAAVKASDAKTKQSVLSVFCCGLVHWLCNNDAPTYEFS